MKAPRLFAVCVDMGGGSPESSTGVSEWVDKRAKAILDLVIALVQSENPGR